MPMTLDKGGNQRSATAIFVGVLLSLLIVEVVGLAVYFARTGALFYSTRPVAQSAVHGSEARESILNAKFALHPYLGYIHRPAMPVTQLKDREELARLLDGAESDPEWVTLKANSHGFFSGHDYPYQGHSDEYIIAVFGGSAAHWFALQGESRLRDRLHRLAAPEDRPITVLNFAQGGFKQPQQLHTLAYFLALGQEFDFVLNLDGFNEVALSHINHQAGIHISMPSAHHILPIVDLLSTSAGNLEKVDFLVELTRSQSTLRRVERWRSSNKSAGLEVLLEALHRRAQRRYLHVLQLGSSTTERWQATDLVHLSEASADEPGSSFPEDAFSLWAGTSLTMQQICEARGIPYLEIIQPNQYFSVKGLSEEERDIAISDRSPYRGAIETAYPMLASQVLDMQRMGIDVISAVEVFDHVAESVYADDCCHYNQIGNEILADFVADEIAARLAVGDGASAAAQSPPEDIKR